MPCAGPLKGVWYGQLAGLVTKQDEIVEIAVHDVETGEEFDSGLISIAESTTRREVRCVPPYFAHVFKVLQRLMISLTPGVDHSRQCA